MKEYKNETLFVAISLFDRFLAKIGHWTYPRDQICLLSTICILIGAKLEQPVQPSMNKMINLLSEDEKINISKEKLLEFEFQMLIRFGFDFNFPSPIQAMERYLRIFDHQNNKIIYDMSY